MLTAQASRPGSELPALPNGSGQQMPNAQASRPGTTQPSQASRPGGTVKQVLLFNQVVNFVQNYNVCTKTKPARPASRPGGAGATDFARSGLPAWRCGQPMLTAPASRPGTALHGSGLPARPLLRHASPYFRPPAGTSRSLAVGRVVVGEKGGYGCTYDIWVRARRAPTPHVILPIR